MLWRSPPASSTNWNSRCPCSASQPSSTLAGRRSWKPVRRITLLPCRGNSNTALAAVQRDVLAGEAVVRPPALVGVLVFPVADAHQRELIPVAAGQRTFSRFSRSWGRCRKSVRAYSCGSALPKASRRSNFASSRTGPPKRVIAILLAAAASRPTAWMWPAGSAQIHVMVHAGGIVRSSDPPHASPRRVSACRRRRDRPWMRSARFRWMPGSRSLTWIIRGIVRRRRSVSLATSVDPELAATRPQTHRSSAVVPALAAAPENGASWPGRAMISPSSVPRPGDPRSQTETVAKPLPAVPFLEDLDDGEPHLEGRA